MNLRFIGPTIHIVSFFGRLEPPRPKKILTKLKPE